MFKFHIRSLFFATAVVAVSIVLLLPSWDAKSEPLSMGPEQLREIVNGYDLRVDIRTTLFGDKFATDGGVYWRTPYSDEILNEHLERLGLAPIKPDRKNVEVMNRQYPSDWPKLSLDSTEWYAFRFNDDRDSNLGSWRTLVSDKRTKMIYCYYASWNYTP